MCILSSVLTFVSAKLDFYTKSEEEILEIRLSDNLEGYCSQLYSVLTNLGLEKSEKYFKYANFVFDVYHYDGSLLFTTREWRDYLLSRQVYPEYDAYHKEKFRDGDDFFSKYEIGSVVGYIPSVFETTDDISITYNLITKGYAFRYSFIAGAVVFFMLTAISFVFLMCTAGHKPRREEIVLSVFDRIPFDIFLLMYAGVFVLMFFFTEAWSGTEHIITLTVFTPVGFVLLLSFFMSFSARVKSGSVLKGCFVTKAVKAVFRILLKLVSAVWGIILKIPVFSKCSLLFLAIFITVFFCYSLFGSRAAFVMSVAVFALLFFAAIKFLVDYNKIRMGVLRIAKGDFFHKINSEKMCTFSKGVAEEINTIGTNLQNVVETGLKSERFKTELITNVSHDLKTPLTSIVNYVDLIKKEKCENEKIGEYIDVLERQAGRLKKLTEDLVEASKASTGNIEIEYSPCELGELLVQTFGEYETRLREAGLTLCSRLPDVPVVILADGRRLWRILDNVFNNIVKYALSSTRVWVSLEVRGDAAHITFKNISKEPLTLSGEELTERFVRADASRNSEGSGLGLSIAKSLTELQQGSFAVTVDDDLFKVEISFKTQTPDR